LIGFDESRISIFIDLLVRGNLLILYASPLLVFDFNHISRISFFFTLDTEIIGVDFLGIGVFIMG